MPLPLSPAYAFISSPLLHVEDLTFVIKPCGPESALSFMKPAGPTQLCRLPGHWSVHPPSLPASFRPKLSPAWTQMPGKAPHPSSPQPPC